MTAGDRHGAAGAAELGCRRPWQLAALAVAIAVACSYWPMLVGQIVFQRDTALWVLPARWLVRQMLLEGGVPAWNPYQGLGFPLLADPQFAVFYPPHWLFVLVPDGWVAHLASWLSLIHLAWGGVGMLLLARRLGVGPVGAAVAGLTWALSGHTTSAWSVGTLLLGEAWIPWVARGFLLLARGEGRTPLLSAVWPLALSLLAGEVFMSAMAACFAAAVVLADGAGLGSARVALGTAARAATAWLLAVGISAVSWLPPLVMVGETERGQAYRRERAELFSHHPLRVLEMLAPGALGEPTGEYPAGRWVGEATVAGAPLIFSTYLGVAALGCVSLALRRRRLPLVLLGVAFVALFVAFGKHAPLHDLWRRVVLPFAHMRSPEKYVVLVVAPLSVLAGLGVGASSAGVGPSLRRLLPLGAGLATLAVTSPWVLPTVLVNDAQRAAMLGLLLFVTLLGLLVARSRFPRAADIGLLVLVAVDLGLPAHALAGFGPVEALTRVPPAAASVLADSRQSPAPPRLYRQPGVESAADPLPADASLRDAQDRTVRSLTPCLPNLHGIATLPAYDAALRDPFDVFGPQTPEELGRTLRLLSMPYLLTTDAAADALARAVPAEVLSQPLPGGRLLRVEHALPRVYVPSWIRGMSLDQAIQHVRDDAVLDGREVVLVADRPRVSPALSVDPSQACRLESYSSTRIAAVCTTPEPNLAVFVEQFAEGWTATVDGAPAPVLPANLLMRAVPIPAGRHRVVLEFRTPGLAFAGVVSLASTLGVLLLVALRGRGRNRPEAPGSLPQERPA